MSVGLMAWQSTCAQHFLPPGDVVLRHDLTFLADSGAINAPLLTWPISGADVRAAIAEISAEELAADELAAYQRLKNRLVSARPRQRWSLSASGASGPVVIRSFEDTPREEAAIGVRWRVHGDRVDAVAQAGVVASPSDGRRARPDGSYVSVRAGNWLLAGGWQERWWGPGRNSSLILSNNARPLPAISVQRNRSYAYESAWLRWIGPWTLSTFVGLMDDDRSVSDALLVGARFTARPFSGLQIGLSRTAQWCGEERLCDSGSFIDLLLGKDNRGVNVGEDEEPGNQLAGFDLRWQLPFSPSTAVYVQWIAEDTRRGGPELGSWLKMAGLEWSGRLGSYHHRSFVEFADTSCRRGGLGFSGIAADCAYEHGIYRTGYRYHGRSIGHSADGDGIAYSAGSTLVQSGGRRWTALLRYAELNRVGSTFISHSLSRVPAEQADLLVSHGRDSSAGSLDIGIGGRLTRSAQGGGDKTQLVLFFKWRSREQR